MRVKSTLACTLGVLLALTPSASAVSKNVEHVKTLPEGKWATAINFLRLRRPGRDAGHRRFGLKSYSLADPANPELLDEITSEDLGCRATRRSTSTRGRDRSRRSGRTRTWTSTSRASSC